MARAPRALIHRARGLRAIACAAALAGATAVPAQERSTTADVIALAVCVIDADIRSAAIARQQRGIERDQALREIEAQMPDAVYRAQAGRLVDEVYRLRPPSLRTHVAERLQRCAAGAARRVEPGAADGCYQLTRYASDFFAARAAGIPLEQAVQRLHELARGQGLAEASARRLADIAAGVYRSDVAAPEFRAGLFFHCVQPVRRRRD